MHNMQFTLKKLMHIFSFMHFFVTLSFYFLILEFVTSIKKSPFKIASLKLKVSSAFQFCFFLPIGSTHFLLGSRPPFLFFVVYLHRVALWLLLEQQQQQQHKRGWGRAAQNRLNCHLSFSYEILYFQIVKNSKLNKISASK